MDAFDPKGGIQPEARLQKKFIKFLRERKWCVKSTHGSVEQAGLPDLFLTHKLHGYRWVDMKVKGSYRITAAQYDFWPQLCRSGSGVHHIHPAGF